MKSDVTSTVEDNQPVSRRYPVPILMVVHAPPDALIKDRCRLFDHFTVGRNADNSLTIKDNKVSGRHLKISAEGAHFSIEDLGSTNGTHLNGERLVRKAPLPPDAVVRIGQTVLVFHGDGEDCLTPPPPVKYGMVGHFHIASILKDIEEAALSREHLLITGPTGSGKELAAKAIHAVMSGGGSSIPYVTHNAACFTSDDDATSTLMGVASRAFTNVDKRPGLIEQAEGGVLFLDEIHNYSTRVQRSLLRIMEDKTYSRIGETATRVANVRFLFASNEPHAIAPDLSGRLRQSLTLPPLTARRADIPSIFDHLLKKKLEGYGIAEKSVRACLKAQHYELMCLFGFEEYNVRGIKHIADIIATKAAAGTAPEETIDRVFSDQLMRSPADSSTRHHLGDLPAAMPDKSHRHGAPTGTSRSKYEAEKETIIALFRDRDGNISSTERALRRRGFNCSRRHLTHYLKKWGVV